MSWLTGKEIEKQVGLGNIVIDPFNVKQINPNSYNYRLSPYMKRITSDVIDLRGIEEYEEFTLQESGTILYPGNCYLGSTVEVLGSDRFASLVTGRSSIGRKFILNHMTAGLIDIGWLGHITLEIVVQKKVRVYPYVEFGQIFWYTVEGEVVLYNGKYQNQETEPVVSRMYMDDE